MGYIERTKRVLLVCALFVVVRGSAEGQAPQCQAFSYAWLNVPPPQPDPWSAGAFIWEMNIPTVEVSVVVQPNGCLWSIWWGGACGGEATTGVRRQFPGLSVALVEILETLAL